ncbi:hypothetical protein ACFPK9_11655 [Rubritalea spongiae]|uniref:Tetratricopeptide repeat protein n=1 Tax=Rubritalea spongiae TaxID=430797 RepID=A0ABW5DZX5_9BACT
MNQTLFKSVVVFGVLALFGALRMPFEQSLSKELQDRQVLSPAFDMEARASLSQKGFIASFGSLRPTLAALYALRTSGELSRSDWSGLEDSFESIVLLDPYNAYYWDLGSWHMAYNAASASRENRDLAPLKRMKLAEEYTRKGENFLDRGIRANPESYELRMAKARMWSRPTVEPDYEKVAETLEQTLSEIDLPETRRESVLRNLFYALLRVPERVDEAYELGRELFKNPQNRVPSLLNGLCALQMHPRVEVVDPLSFEDLYGDRETALALLKNYYAVEDPYKPMYGVKELLERLEYLANSNQ